jgi:hypothetical protein
MRSAIRQSLFTPCRRDASAGASTRSKPCPRGMAPATGASAGQRGYTRAGGRVARHARFRAESARPRVRLQVRELAERGARRVSRAPLHSHRERTYKPYGHRAREHGPVLAVSSTHGRRGGGERRRVERVREYVAWCARAAGSMLDVVKSERAHIAWTPTADGAVSSEVRG